MYTGTRLLRIPTTRPSISPKILPKPFIHSIRGTNFTFPSQIFYLYAWFDVKVTFGFCIEFGLFLGFGFEFDFFLKKLYRNREIWQISGWRV